MEKVMIKKVGQKPEVVEVEEISLKYMQSIVGGYIEMPYISESLNVRNIDIVINEEGKLEGLDPNILLMDKNFEIKDIIVGDILFVSNDKKGKTIGLSDEQIEDLNKVFTHNAVITNLGLFNYIKLEGEDILWT